MLRHVVLFRWKPNTTEAQVASIESALHRLPAQIPCIQSYRFGRDLLIEEGNADFALVADFADQEGLETYANHPEHQAVVRERIRPIMQTREAIQYVIEDRD
jgi:hypothetical protein